MDYSLTATHAFINIDSVPSNMYACNAIHDTRRLNRIHGTMLMPSVVRKIVIGHGNSLKIIHYGQYSNVHSMIR